MPDIDDVLADAQREIKAIGDNVKSLKDTTDKSLADVRKLVEDAPKALAGSDQFKKDVEALIAGVLEKHDAISAKVKALTETALSSATTRMDDIEKKLNRGKLGGGWGDTDEGTKAAQAFARDAKAVKHELKADFDPDKVDLEEIKSYCNAFPVYLRKDDKGLQGAEVEGHVGRLGSGRRLHGDADDRPDHHRRAVRDLADAGGRQYRDHLLGCLRGAPRR